MNKGVHFHFSPGRCSASGSHRASEDLGRLHPSSLSSCSRVITILPPTTSQSQGLDCPNPWGCSGSEPGCSTCAVSEEAEEERGPGHGGGASILFPEVLRLGRVPPRPDLSPCWRHLLFMQISQGSGDAAEEPCGFRNGLSPKGHRDGRGSPSDPLSSQGILLHPLIP